MEENRSIGPEQLIAVQPLLSKAFAKQALSAAPAGYATRFSVGDIAAHAEALSRLSEANPFVIQIDIRNDLDVSVTVVAFDFPGEFSVLTGYLGSTGMDINSGAAFTFHMAAPLSTTSEGVTSRRAARKRYFGPFGPKPEAVLPATRIVDVLTGRITRHDSAESWEREARQRLEHYLALLFANTAESRNQVRQEINEAVAAALQKVDTRFSRTLYPVQISVSTEAADYTRMRVVSEDTPFFLFALSNALSIQDVSIQRVEIRTIGRQVEDEFDFVDNLGKPILDEAMINRIRFSVLLTKQFTYFLNSAPDPYHALLRFESLTEDALGLWYGTKLQQMLVNPRMLQGLARLLGASDFLWEDFLRIQYENILPLLEPGERERTLSSSRKSMPDVLGQALAAASEKKGSQLTAANKRKALNEFKDQQSYLVDVDHILNPGLDFFFLSRRLTGIAELVLRTAVEITHQEMTPQFGVPRTVAGLPARYAIFGLGKLGGAALGYASDVEVLFVYSDNGQTDGTQRIPNAEFFERLFSEAVNSIETKREGIFQVDLRLRPHGKAGPVACSMENFIRYYAPGGEAHSYERLALVRLRWIGGDEELGSQIESIRDEFVYSGRGIDLKQIRELRKLQLAEKASSGRLNAKFSPGALVDLEYSVQILQVIHGKADPALRTSRIHKALEALAAAGAIASVEAERIVHAYRFLRNLINGLRMLRGNAKDLFLPESNSPEYVHLARRMGYEGHDDLTAAEELHIEFETRTAAIRAFVESHLGRDALPGPRAMTVADMVIADEPEEAEALRALRAAGFRKPERSYRNLRSLASTCTSSKSTVAPHTIRERFAALAVLAWGILPRTPDPDMALNNWDSLVRALDDPLAHYNDLLSQPKRLEILLQIMAGSQFLADTLILNPDFFSWATSPRNINSARTREVLESDLREIALAIDLTNWEESPAFRQDDTGSGSAARNQWLRAIRRFRKREILRIGTRDICLGADIQSVITELSNLAGAIIQTSLEYIWKEQPENYRIHLNDFCVLAFGKLGGRELNYSSDVDLLGIYRRSGTSESEEELQLYSRVMEQLRADLSEHNEEGYCYRVDLRLRPYGSSGPLVQSLPAIVRYYTESASTWEYQALLKLTPIAGNQEIGWQFLDEVKPAFLAVWNPTNILATIHDMRIASRQKVSSRTSGHDVKSGRGGIRDIEFTVQGLQLVHSRTHRELLTGNTFAGLQRLTEAGYITPDTAATLKSDYVFLRRVEHFLQLYDDRQVHSLPTSAEGRRAFALRCAGILRDASTPRDANGVREAGIAGLTASQADPEDIVSQFFLLLEKTFERVHTYYLQLLFDGEDQDDP